MATASVFALWTIIIGVGTVIIGLGSYAAGRRRGRVEGYQDGHAAGVAYGMREQFLFAERVRGREGDS